MQSNTLKKCFIVLTSAIQRFQTLCEVRNKHHMVKKNDFIGYSQLLLISG